MQDFSHQQETPIIAECKWCEPGGANMSHATCPKPHNNLYENDGVFSMHTSSQVTTTPTTEPSVSSNNGTVKRGIAMYGLPKTQKFNYFIKKNITKASMSAWCVSSCFLWAVESVVDPIPSRCFRCHCYSHPPWRIAAGFSIFCFG